MVSSSDSTSTVSDTTTSIDTQLRNSIHDFENAVSPEWLQKWLGESDQVLHPRFKRFPDAVDFSNTIYDADNLPMSGTGLFWLDSSVNVKGMHVGPYFNQSLYSTNGPKRFIPSEFARSRADFAATFLNDSHAEVPQSVRDWSIASCQAFIGMRDRLLRIMAFRDPPNARRDNSGANVTRVETGFDHVFTTFSTRPLFNRQAFDPNFQPAGFMLTGTPSRDQRALAKIAVEQRGLNYDEVTWAEDCDRADRTDEEYRTNAPLRNLTATERSNAPWHASVTQLNLGRTMFIDPTELGVYDFYDGVIEPSDYKRAFFGGNYVLVDFSPRCYAIGPNAQNAVKKFIIHLVINKMTIIPMIDDDPEAFSQILSTCLEEKIAELKIKRLDARAGIVQPPTGPAEETDEPTLQQTPAPPIASSLAGGPISPRKRVRPETPPRKGPSSASTSNSPSSRVDDMPSPTKAARVTRSTKATGADVVMQDGAGK